MKQLVPDCIIQRFEAEQRFEIIESFSLSVGGSNSLVFNKRAEIFVHFGFDRDDA
jgi:hypothetical protein